MQPDTTIPEATFDRILKAMGKVRGPVRFNDLTGETPPTADSDHEERTHDDEDEPMPQASGATEEPAQPAHSADRPTRRPRQKTNMNTADEPMDADEDAHTPEPQGGDASAAADPWPEPTLEERE